MSRYGRWSVVLGILAATLPSTARAQRGNDQPYPVGEHQTGMGGAAVAIVRDGASCFYNPAGLGEVRAEGLSASVSAYGIQRQRTSNFIDLGSGVRGDLASSSVLIFPSTLGYVKPVGDRAGATRHALGLSVVVPDYISEAAALDIPPTKYPVTFRAREQLEEKSFWIMPGWGMCTGPTFCFGASLAGVAHLSKDVFTLHSQVDYDTGMTGGGFADSAVTWQHETLSVAGGVVAGVQMRLTPSLRLGATLRTPIRRLHGSGSVLVIESDVASDDPSTPMDDESTAEIRRVEDKKLRIDYQLPARVSVGAGWESGPWSAGLDVHVSLPQDKYATIRTSTGGTDLQPLDPNDQPLGMPITVGADYQRATIVNLNLGAQYAVNTRYGVQFGFFTDRSGLPDAFISELEPRLHRYGLTAGLARRGNRTTTYFAVVGSLGSGVGYGIDEMGEERHVPASSAALLVMLGGNNDFDTDPPPVNSDRPRDAPPPAAPAELAKSAADQPRGFLASLPPDVREALRRISPDGQATAIYDLAVGILRDWIAVHEQPPERPAPPPPRGRGDKKKRRK